MVTQTVTQIGTQKGNIHKTKNLKPKTKNKDISLTTFEIYNNCDENNLIVYVKGEKGLPNKYKLNDKLTFINEAKNGVQSVVKNGVQSVVESVVQTVAIDKLNKTKKKIMLTHYQRKSLASFHRSN